MKGIFSFFKKNKDENKLSIPTKDLFKKEKPIKKKETVNSVLFDISNKNEIDINLLKAFYKVESSGKNFASDGRLIIRFERHIFKRFASKELTQKIIDSQIGLRHRGQSDEYLSLEAAKLIDYDVAYISISMGSMQIMGFHYERLGFNAPKSMFINFSENETNVIKGFGRFLEINPSLIKALRKKNYHKIAYYYNGSAYKKYKDSKGRTYADKIKIAYDKLTKGV